MKNFIFFCLIGFMYCTEVNAQAYLKTEYISAADYKDENNNKVGGRGDMKTVRGGLKIPLSVKIDENNKPTAWAVALSGAYASMNNKNLSTDLCLTEILNAQIGLIHTRPLNEKWSIMAAFGAGWFTSDLDHISGRSILGQGGILFIRHAKRNLDWGVGASLNNILGYPMIFPSVYLDWRLEGKYQFSITMYNSIDASVSMKVNNSFTLSLVATAEGMSTAVTKNGESMLFVNQYSYIGLQPQFIINKWLSIPITAGVSFSRDVYFQKRTIKAFYDDDTTEYPHFNAAIYCSAGIKYSF